MDVGIFVRNFGAAATGETIRAVAEEAERLGFASVWVTDHVVIPSSAVKEFSPNVYEPLTVLGFLAGVTSRVKIGTCILVLPYRHPLLTAKALATADALSGGRLIVGVGAGSLEGEFQALGVPFAERGRITEEAIGALNAAWQDEAARFWGRHVRFADVRCEPKPVQRPRPPLYIAGHTPAALRRAARLGDGWLPSGPPFVEFERGVTGYRRELDRAGKDAGSPQVALLKMVRLRPAPGEATEPAAGPPAKVTEDLRRYVALGATSLILNMPLTSRTQYLDDMATLATEVLPHLET